MSSNSPDRPPAGRLLGELRVRRNVTVGLVAGFLLGTGLYAVRVLELFGPSPDDGSPLLFLALALVFATSAGALVAAALTVARAARVARGVDRDDRKDV